MLAEIIYSFLFAIYAVVLIIWYSIYDEISFNTQHAEIKSIFLKLLNLKPKKMFFKKEGNLSAASLNIF